MDRVQERHRRAVEGFGHGVIELAGSDWDRPTPCAGWTVRDLVNHVVAEELWVEPLLAGDTVADVGARFDGDVLGASPVERAAEAAERAIAAAAGADLDQIVHLSFGDFPARSYLEQLVADHVVHAWDLAASAGLEYAIADDLVDACTEWFERHEQAYRDSGAIAARPVDLPATGLGRLLVMFGRDPDWKPVEP